MGLSIAQSHIINSYFYISIPTRKLSVCPGGRRRSVYGFCFARLACRG